MGAYFWLQSADAGFHSCTEDLRFCFAVCVRKNCVVRLQEDPSCCVSTEDKTERDLFCQSIDLHSVRILKWLHKSSPVLLLFDVVASKAHEDGLIGSLGLAVSVWVICCGFQLSNTKEGAHRGEEFAIRTSTMVNEDVRRKAARVEFMVKEGIFNVRCSCIGRWNSSSPLGLSVGVDKYVFITMCRFWKRSYSIHRNKV